MTRCNRCGGSVMSEPYADARSAGVALLCLSCGHTEEIPTKTYYAETWTSVHAAPGSAGQRISLDAAEVLLGGLRSRDNEMGESSATPAQRDGGRLPAGRNGENEMVDRMPVELRRARYLAYVDQLQARYDEHARECGCERQTRWLGMLLGGARRIAAGWTP
jgi:hypothetical protein